MPDGNGGRAAEHTFDWRTDSTALAMDLGALDQLGAKAEAQQMLDVLVSGEPAVSLDIPARQMTAGTNRLSITQSGSGRLYYVVNRRAYLPRSEIQAAGNVTVTREYLDQVALPVKVYAILHSLPFIFRVLHPS